jgi:hypothetical protein
MVVGTQFAAGNQIPQWPHRACASVVMLAITTVNSRPAHSHVNAVPAVGARLAEVAKVHEDA